VVSVHGAVVRYFGISGGGGADTGTRQKRRVTTTQVPPRSMADDGSLNHDSFNDIIPRCLPCVANRDQLLLLLETTPT